MALWDIHLRFTWQAWHIWHWAGSGGALGSQRPPWSPRLFAWQAWHLATCSCTLRGRRGTLRHPPSFYVAGVALGDIHLRFTWHAWYLVTSTGHVPLLHHLHFCVHCDTFGADEIVVPASSVAIWHLHTSIHPSSHPSVYPSIHPYIHTCIHTCIQHNLPKHNLLVLTLPHTTCSTPILHHLFSLSCFPHAIFTFLLLLVGRSWHVGLSGPLIFLCNPGRWLRACRVTGRISGMFTFYEWRQNGPNALVTARNSEAITSRQPMGNSKKHNSNHLSVHQWLRIRDSQQPISPIGFLFSKLPPPPCAVLLVVTIVLMGLINIPTCSFLGYESTTGTSNSMDFDGFDITPGPGLGKETMVHQFNIAISIGISGS